MDEQDVNDYLKAGKIASEVVTLTRDFVRPGMKLIEIANFVDEKILELGGDFAFPVNLSLNEVAAHYTPSLNDESIAEGLLKVDLGVEINGKIADTAFSLDLTENGEYSEMIKKNEEILREAIENLGYGSKVCVVGKSIGEGLKNSRFNVIQNLSGHSLDDFDVHAGLSVSNYDNENDFELKDIAIAIEPFLTTGVGKVYEGPTGEIFMLQEDKNVRDTNARKLLSFIKEKYKTKPFCKRWLEKEDFNMLGFSLKVLVREGVLHNFPVLIEASKEPVSQQEHSILFVDGKKIVYTLG
jgi:methionyl aminopeptidase